MSAARVSKLHGTLLRGTVLLFCLLLGVALMGATITTSGSGGGSGTTCSGCSANVVPVFDGTNFINSGLTYHANAALVATADNTLDMGALSGSRFRHLHFSGTLHAAGLFLRNVTGSAIPVFGSTGMSRFLAWTL